jgi:hypothetical protein
MTRYYLRASKGLEFGFGVMSEGIGMDCLEQGEGGGEGCGLKNFLLLLGTSGVRVGTWGID